MKYALLIMINLWHYILKANFLLFVLPMSMNAWRVENGFKVKPSKLFSNVGITITTSITIDHHCLPKHFLGKRDQFFITEPNLYCVIFLKSIPLLSNFNSLILVQSSEEHIINLCSDPTW